MTRCIHAHKGMELYIFNKQKNIYSFQTLLELYVLGHKKNSYFQNKQKLYNKTRKYQEKLNPQQIHQKYPLEKFENSFLNDMRIKEIKTEILIRKKIKITF